MPALPRAQSGYRGGLLRLRRIAARAAKAAARDLGLKSTTQDGYAFWHLKSPLPRGKDAVALLESAWGRYQERATATLRSADGDEAPKVREAIGRHLSALQVIAGEGA